MKVEQMLKKYSTIILESCKLLAAQAFACVVTWHCDAVKIIEFVASRQKTMDSRYPPPMCVRVCEGM